MGQDDSPRTIVHAGSLNFDATKTTSELLQLQLDAVNKLFNVYKVEQYALLEELRSSHAEFVRGDKAALKRPALDQHGSIDTSAYAPVQKLEASQEGTMRSLVHHLRQKRLKILESGSNSAPTVPIQQDLIPTVPPDIPESPTSTQPVMPSTSQASDPIGSSPGISLNMWIAPHTSSAVTSTPQSIRDTTSALEFSKGSHDTLGVSESLAQLPARAKTQAAQESEHQPSTEKMPIPSSQGDPQSIALGTSATARYGDQILGYGSDEEVVAFTDVEEELLPDSTSFQCNTASTAPRIQDWRQRFKDNCPEILALEAIASTTSQQDLDLEQALACLCGRSGRYLIRRTHILIGRDTEAKGSVDIDLSREVRHVDAAKKVSRRQAFLSLLPDGSFQIQNVGKRLLQVDGKVLQQFQTESMNHLSVVEIGECRLMFMVNSLAVQRVLNRTGRLVI
ncbi:hypothetical protein CEUSTIGMA_g10663.t1 [Chlamydomonas eustigma]|uniref:FHA domain-containing protein n=1 Tax=Chlamydomonas eustigma TaxID=1157962 RepID=A0A250XJI7_9CHLO|nr:hypothetical protein CEUSTIGMA_g10663.t1 [Chlamydomonas eustigma]|eukprot:GAX83237.1 hypothetical protein CEUSTIGMA_g10663.t1 [Chlamydomonas eustigma]